MTRQEQAEKWILSHCSETGEPVDFPISATDLPSGLSIRLIKNTFGKLKSADRISGHILETDNAGFKMMGLRCERISDRPQSGKGK